MNSEPNTVPGINKGLIVILDLHKDLYQFGSQNTDENFFLTMISPTGNFPTSNYKSVRVIPGHLNTITVTAGMQDADQAIAGIAPPDRNCFFPQENQVLSMHQNYTQYNCLLECSLQFAWSTVQVSLSVFWRTIMPIHVKSTSPILHIKEWPDKNKALHLSNLTDILHAALAIRGHSIPSLVSSVSNCKLFSWLLVDFNIKTKF